MKQKEETVLAEDTAEESVKKPSRFQGFQLLIVQSIACVVIILLTLLLRVIGGDLFADISTRLRAGLTDQTLVSSVVSLFDSVAQTPAQENTTATTTTTAAQQTVQASAQPVMMTASVAQTAAGGSSLNGVQQVCAPLLGGIISSYFGQREDPFDSETTSTHHGLDIAADEGTPLFAMMEGLVVDVDYEENGYGNHLIVQCANGNRYLYAHCAEVLVKEGAYVSAGQQVAIVGSTGRSTGSHLHVEWRVNGELVDPLTIVPEQTYA